VGVFTITSMAAILVITSVAYAAIRGEGTGKDPVAVAAANIRVSHAALVLEQERQSMIALDAASKAGSVQSAPELAEQPTQADQAGGGGGTTDDTVAAPPDPGTAQADAFSLLPEFGFTASTQYPCLNDIYTRESGWRYNAENGESGAYGIPQALPGDKMASAGPDWQTNVTTQIKWGLGYIQSRYGTPCGAWSFWQAHGWY
jgi:hypothetical protein